MLINLTISTFVRDKISRKKIEHVWPDHEIHSHHLMHDGQTQENAVNNTLFKKPLIFHIFWNITFEHDCIMHASCFKD